MLLLRWIRKEKRLTIKINLTIKWCFSRALRLRAFCFADVQVNNTPYCGDNFGITSRILDSLNLS